MKKNWLEIEEDTLEGLVSGRNRGQVTWALDLIPAQPRAVTFVAWRVS